jgi:hypothetical protein
VEQGNIVKMDPAPTSHVAKKKLQHVNLRGNVPIAVGAAPPASPVLSVAYLAISQPLMEVLLRTCRLV